MSELSSPSIPAHPPSTLPIPFAAPAPEGAIARHKALLELAAQGAPLQDVLQALVRTAGSLTAEGARAAIFMLDANEPRLRFQVAHGLPDSCTSAMDRFAIGAHQSSRGPAAAAQSVIVRDVALDPNWQPYLAHAQAHDIRACWSFPLHSASGRLLGAFAIFHAQPREPDPAQYEEARFLANIASLVIAREKETLDRVREREQAEQALRDANRRKDVFIAMLGHELRNPIGTLRNSLHILERTLPEPKPRPLSVMDRQIQQLTRLTDDLMDASRIAQGKLEMRMERIELHAAVQQAIETARPLCSNKSQQLEYEPLPEPVYLVADAARVTQMVTNLLTNASKFTPGGGRVRVKLAREPGSASVQVKDSGVGIAPEQREHVFEMFAQLDEGKQVGHQGLGIGLSLVKKLATSHGGSIEVQSPGLGQGSEFTLRLPAQR